MSLLQNKEVSLYFTYNKNGPARVIDNLCKGLVINNYSVLLNPQTPRGWVGLLQDHPVRSYMSMNKNDALLGPNLFVLPDESTESRQLCDNFSHFLCPSDWVSKKYRSFSVLDQASIDIWPVGIDTEVWCGRNSARNSEEKHVLLYTKSKSRLEAQNAYNTISKAGCRVTHIDYGSYSESDFHSLCHSVDCCVLLTGTESQGIAYMQILSCGIPCYVVDTDTWVDSRRNLSFRATSVPYFNDSCGVKVRSLEESTLTQFLENISEYDPRDYIVKNHSLKTNATSYISIMQKYNCRVW